MKKLLLITASFLLVLSGCGNQSAYENLVSDVSGLDKTDTLMLTFGATVDGTDTKLDGKQIEMNYILDLKNKLLEFYINDSKIFANVDSVFVYINSLDKWFKADNQEDFSDIEDTTTFEGELDEMPAGDTTFTDGFTGVESIDSQLTGKTLDEAVISTGNNSYSITSLEDYLTIDTNDGVKISITAPSYGSAYVGLKQSKNISLPQETTDAKDITNLIS